MKKLKEKNIGFAAINISKYINDSENSQISDKNLINNFLSDSEFGTTDFIRRQVKILDPDIIITGNLWDSRIGIEKYLDNYFSKKVKVLEDGNVYAGWLYTVNINNKNIKLVDVYHFSSHKTDMNFYYAPISKLIKYGASD